MEFRKNRCWKLQGQKWKSEKLYLKLFQVNLSQCGCGGPHLESIQSCWRRKLWRRGDSSQSRCTSPRDSSKAFQELIKVVKRGRRTFSIVLVSYSLIEELQEPSPTSFSIKCSQTQGSFPITLYIWYKMLVTFLQSFAQLCWYEAELKVLTGTEARICILLLKWRKRLTR